jgi:hypothetical protein
MNSPVCHIAAPNTNMTGRKRNNNNNNSPSNGNNGNSTALTVRQRRPAPARLIQQPRYSKTAPAAMGGITSKQRGTLPLSVGMGRKMVVQNYELIASVKSFATDTFASLLSSYTCNPGIAGFTPWLSGLALQYSKFNWKTLRFIYVPKVPTAIPGQAFIMVGYDPADTAPANIADVAVTDSSSIGPVWVGGGINQEKAFRSNLGIDEAIFVDVDCKSLTQPYYYVRKQAGLDADTKPFVLFFGTAGALTGVGAYGATGDIYVAYTVELFEPVQAALNI